MQVDIKYGCCFLYRYAVTADFLHMRQVFCDGRVGCIIFVEDLLNICKDKAFKQCHNKRNKSEKEMREIVKNRDSTVFRTRQDEGGYI